MAQTLFDVDDYARAMRRRVPRFVCDYVVGGAESESCMARNRRDLDSVALVPRVLRDTRGLDMRIEVFGSTWRYPFAIAPTGLNGLLSTRGDSLLAAAAATAGIPFTLSTASNETLEDIRCAAPAGEQWLQLYVMEERRIAEQLVERAKASGCRALVLTVDVPVSGHRLRDLRNRFALPLRPTPRLLLDLLAHPRWSWRQAVHGLPRFANLLPAGTNDSSIDAGAALLARRMDRSLDWQALKWLRSLWDGPLMLKGILHADDARKAIDHAVDGVIVSNHGGRQLDAAPSAITALPRIAEAVGDRIAVFMDSGIRSGADIVRALALGARAVFVGRPVLYGLAAGGESGARAEIGRASCRERVW